MKKLALTVSALSTLYSDVIVKIINPGFSLAAQASHYEEGNSITIIADKQRRLNQYLQGAETQCQLFAVKVCGLVKICCHLTSCALADQ